MSKDPKSPPPSPWLRGVPGVSGVRPPGRRLDDGPRPNPWSASGVRGVTPPGRAAPEPSPRWATTTQKANARALERRRAAAGRGSARPAAAPRPSEVRPQAGFLPDVFADLTDPPDLQAFLKTLSDFLAAHPPHEEAIDAVEQLILQSRAPFELVVGYTVMSALVGKDKSLRREFEVPLERGANAFFNLAQRLDPRVPVPRGVSPRDLDALFFDLPDLALQVPFAFATDAFCRTMGLLRDGGDEAYDEALVDCAAELRARFIDRRSYGDEPLARLFPWSPPEWTPPTWSPPDAGS